MSEKKIIEKQKEALINTRNFIKGHNLKNPLTGKIWKLLNDENSQSKISDEDSLKLKDNWSKDLIGELQRELVNYQLYQMKLGNPPKLFEVIKEVFNEINNKNIVYNLLDVGCTSGYYFEIINFYFPNIFKYNGCDYNPESIKLAKKYYPNINFFVDDLTNLSTDRSAPNASIDTTSATTHTAHESAVDDGCSMTVKVARTSIVAAGIKGEEQSSEMDTNASLAVTGAVVGAGNGADTNLNDNIDDSATDAETSMDVADAD